MIDPTKLTQATDFDAPSFTGQVVPLYMVAVANMRAGRGLILRDRTFTDCLIEGPAVVVGLEGVRFERCELGAATDRKDLMLKPIGDGATGAIGLLGCTFTGCDLRAIGYTGHESFLHALLSPDGLTR